MKPYRYQNVAKARIRKNDYISFRMEPNGPIISGTVMNVSGSRNRYGAYSEVYIGGTAVGNFQYGKWYDTDKMIICNHLYFKDEGSCHLMITYHMKKNHAANVIDPPIWESAETCIMLPMTVEVADDILQNEAESPYLKQGLCGGLVYEALAKICAIQGYEYECFCCAELVFLSDFSRNVE